MVIEKQCSREGEKRRRGRREVGREKKKERETGSEPERGEDRRWMGSSED
jgi:hypothetical protein